ncbi:MAG TPA: dephospho-CoA kinase [bacterium]|nr:dephospho-CoA kinase [bacterium]
MSARKPQGGKSTRVVGLTGGIGAGKSEVLALLKAEGFPVLQADQVGHGLLADRAFARKIQKRFGPGVLDSRGRVDRRQLGRLVFAHPAERKALNQLLHPRIRQKIRAWVGKVKKYRKKPALAAVEIPLLFEGRGYSYLDGVLSVSAPASVRHRRLRARGWTAAEISRREKGQWSQSRKDARAHWVIRNSGSRQALRRRVEGWLQAAGIKEKKA